MYGCPQVALTDVRAKILLYDCIFLRHLRISKSENRDYFQSLLHVEKELLDFQLLENLGINNSTSRMLSER